MDSADIAIDFVLKNEGGFVNNLHDSGGATNFGISLRFLREVPKADLKKYGIFSDPLTAADIKNLTVDQAKLIYRGEYWDDMPLQEIYNQTLCNYIFDMCVSHGISMGIKLAQRALWAYHHQLHYVADDGVLGSKTLHEINDANEIFLIDILIAERAGYMRLLAGEKVNDKEFIDGWLARCYRI